MNRRAAVAGTGSLLALVFGATPPPAAVWPQALPGPGGVARLALGAGAARPVAHHAPGAPALGGGVVGGGGGGRGGGRGRGHLDVRVLVQGDASAWAAVVGIALAAPPGPACISVQADGADGADGAGSRPLPYTIGTKQYPQQHLTVPPRMVDLSPEDLARHQRERAHQALVIATFTEQPAGRAAPSLRMQAPVPGPRSGSFGVRRVFNGQARSPHSGMDIAAATGTSIAAPLLARVIDTGDYFFNGNTVWLDHGQGLLSMMCHLSAIDVQRGDVLQTRQHLRPVRATPPVTGPHLHWSVVLNRTMVDPALFVPA